MKTMANTLGLAGLGLLTACSGGSNDASPVPTNPQEVTQQNATEIAGAHMDTLFFMFSAEDLSGAIPTAPLMLGGRQSAEERFNLVGFSRMLVDRIVRAPMPAGNGTAQAVLTVGPQACDMGGSATFTWNDADNNTELSAGDTISVHFTQCSDDGVSTINGGVSVTINALTLDPSSGEALTFDWTFNFLALSLIEPDETVMINGGYRFAFTATDLVNGSATVELTGVVLTVLDTDAMGTEAIQASNFRFYFDVDGVQGTYAADSDYTLAATRIGGMVNVTTDPQFTGMLDQFGEPLDPLLGVSTITGSNGSSVTLDADTGDPLTCFLSINGGQALEVTWASLQDGV